MSQSINTKEVEYIIDNIIDQNNYLRDILKKQDNPIADHLAKKLGHQYYLMKDVKELFVLATQTTDIDLIED